VAISVDGVEDEVRDRRAEFELTIGAIAFSILSVAVLLTNGVVTGDNYQPFQRAVAALDRGKVALGSSITHFTVIHHSQEKASLHLITSSLKHLAILPDL
jgi:hypothetical protein